MSRYGVDKVLRALVVGHPEARAVFEADRDAWLAAGTALTEEERRALRDLDIGALYAGGAHPFLLWMACCVLIDEPPPRLYGRYMRAVGPHGYPDFAT